MRIGQWLKQAFEIESISGQEYKFNCPECGGSNFYFNIAKKLGFCHHADCHWSPKIQDLIDKVGFAPDSDGGYAPPILPLGKIKILGPVTLPSDCKPVIETIDGVKHTYNPEAYQYLIGRNLTIKDIIRFNIHANSERIYIPVYETIEDKVTMISYVSRGIHTKGYLYPENGGQTSTLFGWDEARYWPSLFLVENTFVSIWLRDKLQCVSTFGSHLSKEQLVKISQSAAKKVVLAWDENSEVAAQKAVRKLRTFGKNAFFLIMKGQPDHYSLECIQYNRARAHTLLEEGHESAHWRDIESASTTAENG